MKKINKVVRKLLNDKAYLNKIEQLTVSRIIQYLLKVTKYLKYLSDLLSIFKPKKINKYLVNNLIGIHTKVKFSKVLCLILRNDY